MQLWHVTVFDMLALRALLLSTSDAHGCYEMRFHMSHCVLWLAMIALWEPLQLQIAEMSGAVCSVVMKPCHIGMCAGTCITAAKP